MPRYILHIGPHKTGSTYLQNALKAMGGFLRERGILYPTDLGALGHMQLSRMLRVPDSHDTLGAQFRAYAQSGCATVVLSAEDLAPLHDAELRVLQQLIGDNPVHVVFYCRASVGVAVSNWGELIRHGFATPLDEALAEWLGQPRRSPPINYGRALRRYAEVFGEASLNLVSLEGVSAAADDIVLHFLRSFLDIDEPLPPGLVRASRRNMALPLGDAELIRVFNAMRIERQGKRDAQMRRTYELRQGQLSLVKTRGAIEQHAGVIEADETLPPLITLHTQLYTQYGRYVVPPAPVGQFFVPRLHKVPFIRRDYLADPDVSRELDAAYVLLDKMAEARPSGYV